MHLQSLVWSYMCIKVLCVMIWWNCMMNWGMFDHVRSYDMYMCTYVMRQYEFSDSCKARMIPLSRGLCWVRVKCFLLAISLWHELVRVLLPKDLLGLLVVYGKQGKGHSQDMLLRRKGRVVDYERFSYDLTLLGGNILIIMYCGFGTCDGL